jgi:hypothetical protein
MSKTVKENVVRDANGEVENIGAWHDKVLPSGYTQTLEDVVTMDDGGRYAATDYKKRRRAEYPSEADQLDDIFHNGLDGWKANIQTIKDKYPK